MAPTVLFPADPLNGRRVDPEFEAEWAALQFAGVTRALVTPNLDSAVANGESLFRGLPEDGGYVVYRGWMLSMHEIALLDVHLHTKGHVLVTRPGQYVAAHHMVNWLAPFESLTPKTAFVNPDASTTDIMAAAFTTGAQAFMVKDWVKSRKHEWASAAYAPDFGALEAVVREFVRLQGEYLVGQVGIREYVELDKAAGEQRLWWVSGELAMATGHPDTPQATFELSDDFLSKVQAAVRKLGSPFVTTDIALKTDGTALVIEVGDGQVSGLPAGFDGEEYAATLQRLLTA